jgi:hypothetical protein
MRPDNGRLCSLGPQSSYDSTSTKAYWYSSAPVPLLTALAPKAVAARDKTDMKRATDGMRRSTASPGSVRNLV